MVYDWDAHQQTCYRLYIEEDRPLEEIMDYMKTRHKFAPRRAYQTQFRRWKFPPKQHPAYKNDQLVDRIKGLWEHNLTHGEMLRILNEEDGFNIKSRELMRVRARFRWLLRAPNGDKSKPPVADIDEDSSMADLSATRSISTGSAMPDDSNADISSNDSLSPLCTPSVADNGKSKCRRQRTCGKITPPDGQEAKARCPSEMTLEEARQILGLDFTAYRHLRSNYERICREDGIAKKTLAGPQDWAAAKMRLASDFPQLYKTLGLETGGAHRQRLALDVICIDVTKRMRNSEMRMTLAEAKNLLGVNPDESRNLRVAFHQLLTGSRFTRRSDVSPQQWRELKWRWAQRSTLVKSVLDGDESDLKGSKKARALEVVARDVMKRFRDERTRPKKGSSGSQPPAVDQRSYGIELTMLPQQTAGNFKDNQSAPAQVRHFEGGPSMVSDSQTVSGPMFSGPGPEAAYVDQSCAQSPPFAAAYEAASSASPACAVYLRLHPSSTMLAAPDLWIATLSHRSLEELRRVAAERFPDTFCARIEGLLRGDKGRSLPLLIERDQELDAYVEHLQGGSPTFNVELRWKAA